MRNNRRKEGANNPDNNYQERIKLTLQTKMKHFDKEVMGNEKTLTLSREKHLDHMVRVVPFIVFCYAVQCFVITKIGPGDFSTISLAILGGFLALMIAGFITYDVKHRVILDDSGINIQFLGTTKLVSYDEIWMIEINDPDQSFSTIKLHGQKGKITFYFVDESNKIKKWIEDHQTKSQIKEAA